MSEPHDIADSPWDEITGPRAPYADRIDWRASLVMADGSRMHVTSADLQGPNGTTGFPNEVFERARRMSIDAMREGKPVPRPALTDAQREAWTRPLKSVAEAAHA